MTASQRSELTTRRAISASLVGLMVAGLAGRSTRPAAASSSSTSAVPATQATQRRPNFVIILVDDMGYSDLHIDGNPVIQTPNIDRMANEGTHLTSMYAAPVCTPSRGELLTGRYPVRTGLINVTGPGSPQGIRQDEVSIAQALKQYGYRTAMYGKWHVGDFDSNPQWNPVNHGFDEFLGLPYSHDYNPPAGVPLYHNLQKVEQPVRYDLLTQRYTNEAVKFIRASSDRPFLVYLAHNMPHIPIATSPEFVGHSRAGRYGDVIEELDWSVGEVMAAVKAIGADDNTVIVFQSDNGPWLGTLMQTYDRKERGQKLPGDVGWTFFRGSKGETYEGGIRVPGFVRWPGHIPAARVTADMISVMDWYPTFVSLAGGKVDHPIDGVDQSAFLLGKGPDARTELFSFSGAAIEAVRQGQWKLRIGPPQGVLFVPPGIPSQAGGPPLLPPVPPGFKVTNERPEPVTELFDLDVDPSERINVAAEHTDIVQKLKTRMTKMQATLQASAQPVTEAAGRFVETVSPLD